MEIVWGRDNTRSCTATPPPCERASLYRPSVQVAFRHVAEHPHLPVYFCPEHPGVTDDERVAQTMDKLSVNFGYEILKYVKGYVSTEVDARLSFDTEATLERAHNIIALYEAVGERSKKKPR